MNFAGHSLLGLLAGAIAALFVAGTAPTTLSVFPLPFLVPAAVLALVYLGAVYPDVDLHDSIPRRRVLPYLQALAVGGVALAGFLAWDWFVGLGRAILGLVEVSAGPTLAGSAAAVLSAGLAVAAVEPTLSVLTGAHRTWTHSVAVNGVAALAIGAAIWLAVPLRGDDRLVLAALPLAFALGVAVHRFADEAV